jgi:hypothetical protein
MGVCVCFNGSRMVETNHRSRCWEIHLEERAGDGSRGFGPWWGAGATPLLLAFFEGVGAAGREEAWILRLWLKMAGGSDGAWEWRDGEPPSGSPLPKSRGERRKEAGGCSQAPWPM